WIFWIDDDPGNVTCIFEADMGPRLAAIGRFVHAVADRFLASADVNNFWIRRRQRQGPNRGNVRVIENWFPYAAAVDCLPDSAARRAEVINFRTSRDARDAGHSPGAMRTHQPPMHG